MTLMWIRARDKVITNNTYAFYAIFSLTSNNSNEKANCAILAVGKK